MLMHSSKTYLKERKEGRKKDRSYLTLSTSLVVQWLRLCASAARAVGSIPGRGTKIPHAAWHGQKNKKEVSHSYYAWDTYSIAF